MPQPVIDAVLAHLDLEARIGGYEAGTRAMDRIDGAYASIARMLGCDSDEIAMVESATVAWNRCFLALTADLRAGDRILTGRAEYASNYIAMLQLAKRQGVSIEVVPDDSSGSLDPAALESMMDETVKLIAVTHVPTSGSLVNPAVAIGQVAKKFNVPFLLDACQSAGQMPLDVNAIGCDALSATGRKYLRGPRGSGFLYIKRELANRIEPPDLDLHGAKWTGLDTYEACVGARRFEYFEGSIANRIALGVAVDYAMTLGLDEIWSRVQYLGDGLRQRLEQVPGVTLCDTGEVKCGIVTFVHDALDADVIAGRLRIKGINVGKSETNSTRIDLEGRGIEELVRAPVHYFNTDEELDTFVEELGKLDRGRQQAKGGRILIDAGSRDGFRRNTGDGAAGLNVLQYNAAGSNFSVVAHGYRPKHGRAGANQNAAADRWMSITRFLTRTAKGYAVKHRHVVADNGGLADDDARGVVH